MEDVRFLGRHIGVAREKANGVRAVLFYWDFVPNDKAIVAGIPAGFLGVDFENNSFEVTLPRENAQEAFKKFVVPITSIIQLIGE